jgi:aspartyl-tRNA(Asn)/glutamyl-tRNA(Gln) amidotransferase subunit A
LHSSYRQIRAALDQKQTTCQAIVGHYLRQIAEHNAQLNVFLEVYDQEALARAQQIDEKIAQGTAGRLAGMVVGLKDVICYQGHRLQAGSRILAGFVSQFSATVVDKLLAEDAIIIGHQNCDEFAMGSSNENSAFGPTRNALDPTRVPGGSSGASAVAVQAGMCTVSLGSDTGGSVRQPASFCGLVGLKPTYSRVSRHGLLAYASSFDVIGVLAHEVADAALVLEVIAGPDEFDSTVSQLPVPAYSQSLGSSQPLKIAYIKETVFSQGLQPAVQQATLAALEAMRQAGHEVEEVEFPLLEYILPTYYILTTAEASTNLARYDGVRYGYRSPNATDLESMYKKTRSEGFGEEVKRRIMLGTFVLGSSYQDAYFTKAQRVRRLIQERTLALLGQYDFLVSPTTPSTAFKIGALDGHPLEMYLADIFSVQANVAGIPAISIPVGADQQGLPIGLQLMAGYFAEEKMLGLAQSLSHILSQDPVLT